MKWFYPERHASHAPVWYVADGCVRPCPEVPARAVAIVRTLLETPGMDQAALPAVDPWPALRAIHDAGYLDYLRTIHDLWTAEFGACDVLPDTFIPPAIRTRARRPAKPSAQAGFYSFDMAAPIGADTWQAALDSATCACAAARAVYAGLSPGTLQQRAAYALCRPPGHHAGPDYCGGFCFLNNVAIAAESLRLAGARRVAILDVDYHHGNGTQDIFYSRPDVLFVSLHAEPDTQYPYFWGHADETGAGAGEGFTANFPLPRGCDARRWLETLQRALDRIRGFDPQALLISLGVDTAAFDGVGDFQLELDDFHTLGRALAAADLPTVFVQEGGYNVQKIGAAVAAVLQGFASR
ncbi:MAG TPA: histone deacetylase family protein [Phycisphaerae bacterium]|nr:histone deacetylase family protein [Phycisphaerae bacterium]